MAKSVTAGSVSGNAYASKPSLFSAVAGWYRHWTEMQSLAALDDRMLRDIGLNRGAVQVEVAKPFWRVQ